MVGIVFTTEEEAKPFLLGYKRGRFDGLAEGESYHDDDILVSLLGTGKIKATLRTERLLNAYKLSRIMHVGTCTALDTKLRMRTIVSASQVFEGDRIELAAPSYPRMPLEAPLTDTKRVTLVTQDHRIEDESEISYWQRIADAVDMTGYAVAYVAATHGVPCNIVEVISAKANREDKDLQETLEKSYDTLARFLNKEIEAIQAQSEESA